MKNRAMDKPPEIQVVFVKWGTKKYSGAYVNALVDAVRQHTKANVKFVCFTEVPDGLDSTIEVRPFPDQGQPLEHLIGRQGSLPKLGMFKPGELLPDVPTIYLDLDSAVFGDIDRLAAELRRKRGLYLCSRHWLQYWRYRWLAHSFDRNRYYLGNTAVMAFYPGDWAEIWHRFLREYPAFLEAPETMDRTVRRAYVEGNERIICLTAQRESRVFKHRNVTKFTEEYMAPYLWLSVVRDYLPWVQARRASQAVITFHGENLKPKILAHAKPGDILTHKFHKVRWNYPRITAFWQDVLRRDGKM